MQLQLRSEQIAGLLSLLAALLAGVAWYIYLFVATPSERPLADSVHAQLASSFALENADRWWFIWFAALPLALTVVGDTADAFFNSPIGYRAQFLHDPEIGQSCNAQLLNSLLDRLLVAPSSLPAPKHEMPTERLRASLSAFSAKVWICESGFPFDHNLVEALRVEPWLSSARAAAAAFQQQTTPSPPQQEKAIWGIRAPVNSTLEVKGAFLSADDSERVPVDKIHRAHEIHVFGWS